MTGREWWDVSIISAVNTSIDNIDPRVRNVTQFVPLSERPKINTYTSSLLYSKQTFPTPVFLHCPSRWRGGSRRGDHQHFLIPRGSRSRRLHRCGRRIYTHSIPHLWIVVWDKLVYGNENHALVRVDRLLLRADAGKAAARATAVAAEPQACEGEDAEYDHQDHDSRR